MKSQLLYDSLLYTDPVTAAPQPMRLQERCMANTTQGHSQHRTAPLGSRQKSLLGLGTANILLWQHLVQAITVSARS